MRNILILSILFSFPGLQGQDSLNIDTPSTWKMLKYDTGNMFKGVGYAYSRPFHWKRQQWGNAALVSAGAGGLFLVDYETSDFLRERKDNVPQFIREYGEFIGNPENNYIMTAGVYFSGLITKNEKLRRTGVLLVSSASATGFLQQIMKSVVGRARPLSDHSKATFDPFNKSRNYHSFPSGHAMMAFTNAYAIGKQFKNPWVKGGIYTIGLVPGISRVWDGQHWLSDVAVSIAISIFTVEAIDRYLDNRYHTKYNQGSKQVQWSLSLGPGRFGIIGTF
ncbi:phosphatase PAP2 family protein [Maribacter sp. HTCC2170]|uniref:phosphatase PAP2 family protein n=1 Tax=Maribacter sp. (strain HTCC2170 / KCCM 42371) TaxID=313603 RepID=UPI00006BD3C5|nr:phosphatase PAP2 family protein [Maribacter sp. HTCC2170]EAR02485.1 Phosphoesterase, PA-phosphatase related protein [Maribacter sp. HTCC2170]